MGRNSSFKREKLILPVLFTDPGALAGASTALIRRFGPVDYRSGELPFTFTRYYEREMGKGIRRLFLSFEKPVDPAALSSIKRFTNRIEARFQGDRGRRINLDPGLLDLNRLLLATTKYAGHRIPLRRGIYAEITLHFREGRFQALPWTYPDFRSPEYREILLTVRELFHRQLKQRG